MPHNCRWIGWTTLAFAFLAPLFAADDKKDDPKEKLYPFGQITARVKDVKASDKVMTVEIPAGGGKWTAMGITAIDDVIVRVRNLPQETDDKGKPKKYTAEEIKKLKGPNSKLPGYTAEFDQIRQGQTVQISLSKKKDPPRTAGKKKDEDAVENKPVATMIVIVAEAPVK